MAKKTCFTFIPTFKKVREEGGGACLIHWPSEWWLIWRRALIGTWVLIRGNTEILKTSSPDNLGNDTTTILKSVNTRNEKYLIISLLTNSLNFEIEKVLWRTSLQYL